MLSCLRKLFTGRDNQTWDLGRFLWAGFSTSLIVLQAHAVIHSQAFDPIAFSTGAGAILAAGAAGLGMKAHTEPDRPEDKP
jgi:hypothetical protein